MHLLTRLSMQEIVDLIAPYFEEDEELQLDGGKVFVIFPSNVSLLLRCIKFLFEVHLHVVFSTDESRFTLRRMSKSQR